MLSQGEVRFALAAHQRAGVDAQAEARRAVGQQRQEGDAVLFVAEDRLAPRPAVHDVVASVGVIEAKGAGVG